MSQVFLYPIDDEQIASSAPSVLQQARVWGPDFAMETHTDPSVVATSARGDNTLGGLWEPPHHGGANEWTRVLIRQQLLRAAGLQLPREELQRKPGRAAMFVPGGKHLFSKGCSWQRCILQGELHLRELTASDREKREIPYNIFNDSCF